MSVYNNSVIIDLCESISRHFQQGEGTFNKEKTLWFACAMHHLRIMCPVKYGHLYQAEERARSPALLTLHHLINIYTGSTESQGIVTGPAWNQDTTLSPPYLLSLP